MFTVRLEGSASWTVRVPAQEGDCSPQEGGPEVTVRRPGGTPLKFTLVIPMAPNIYGLYPEHPKGILWMIRESRVELLEGETCQRPGFSYAHNCGRHDALKYLSNSVTYERTETA
ncbi:hypothetical protein J6590_069296 [Homalodisca vitripennis]|nr:hypothetical protein J6590_069296 [Homalodisca vitripennis]